MKMKKKTLFGAIIVSMMIATNLFQLTAAPVSPEGMYYNIADEGEEKGKAAYHIQLWVQNGTLYGKIVKLLLKPQDSKCDKCEGNLKNSPIIGLVFLRGLKYDAADDVWSGGYWLDPNNGKWYKSFIKVKDGGKKLEVRGHIGVSLSGRTQNWFKLN